MQIFELNFTPEVLASKKKRRSFLATFLLTTPSIFSDERRSCKRTKVGQSYPDKPTAFNSSLCFKQPLRYSCSTLGNLFVLMNLVKHNLRKWHGISRCFGITQLVFSDQSPQSQNFDFSSSINLKKKKKKTSNKILKNAYNMFSCSTERLPALSRKPLLSRTGLSISGEIWSVSSHACE